MVDAKYSLKGMSISMQQRTFFTIILIIPDYDTSHVYNEYIYTVYDYDKIIKTPRPVIITHFDRGSTLL